MFVGIVFPWRKIESDRWHIGVKQPLLVEWPCRQVRYKAAVQKFTEHFFRSMNRFALKFKFARLKDNRETNRSRYGLCNRDIGCFLITKQLKALGRRIGCDDFQRDALRVMKILEGDRFGVSSPINLFLEFGLQRKIDEIMHLVDRCQSS
ncbi:hypothetical protein D3C87_1722040 [compost metagenome]